LHFSYQSVNVIFDHFLVLFKVFRYGCSGIFSYGRSRILSYFRQIALQKINLIVGFLFLQIIQKWVSITLFRNFNDCLVDLLRNVVSNLGPFFLALSKILKLNRRKNRGYFINDK